MGGSRWCFGRNRIVANIDLGPSLLQFIKGMKPVEGLSDDQMRQVATEILQPYLDEKLSVTEDGKAYPVKVDRLVKQRERLHDLDLGRANPARPGAARHHRLQAALRRDPERAREPRLRLLVRIHRRRSEVGVRLLTSRDAVYVRVIGARLDGDRAGHRQDRGEGEHVGDRVARTGRRKTRRRRRSGGAGSAGADADIARSRWREILANVGRFVLLGIEHILTGYDHIAFLVALVVVAPSFKAVLPIITAFTAAHSITLLLAALRVVSLNSRLVESAIAVSICYVAVENLFRKKATRRWLVAFCFGLVHGFGFASVLQTLIVGRANLVSSVVSFNVGVELGQLMIFAALLPLLRLLAALIAAPEDHHRRLGRHRPFGVHLGP
jgi:hydrogenase/urease accessory protein HupE